MSNGEWHRFLETYDNDDQCTTCEVVVIRGAMASFTAPCPTPDCGARANPDRGCVFVPPGRSDVCRCIYCGAAGGKAPVVDPDEEPVEVDADPALAP